jgi:methyltransferase family protein
MEFQVFPNGGIQPRRYRPGGVGNWSGHLPFAYDLVAAMRPSLLVELGTHYGESYFGFCQAVAEKDIPCSCYAVDTWVGEAHSGFYDESVYRDVSAHNSAYYSSFSYLLRTTFDSALSNFADESIDILHIDGLHTYEAVSKDVQSWMPKVKPGGIILLHDIMARHADFGVWNVWQQLEATGSHFAFLHSWGLGVFRKPGPAEEVNELLTALFHSSAENQEHLRKYYALCANKLEYEYDRANRTYAPDGKILIQIYPFGENGYSSARCINAYVDSGCWGHVSIELASGIGNGALRIDPGDRTAVIDIAGIVIRRLMDGEILWGARGCSDLAAISVGGTLTRLDNSENQEYCRFISNGPDPQLFLPEVDRERFDQPLFVEIWLRIRSDIGGLLPLLQAADQQRSRTQIIEAKLAEASTAVVERQRLAEHRDQLIVERDGLLRTCQKLQSELYVTKSDLKDRLLYGEEQHSEAEKYRNSLAKMQEQLAASEATLQGVLASRSWRVTAPMRGLILQLRRLRRS